MATATCLFRSRTAFNSLRLIARTSPFTLRRALSTLSETPDIYVHTETGGSSKHYVYTYLANEPPIAALAIGTSETNPPTPDNLKENHEFMDIVHYVIRENAANDPDMQSKAAMFQSQAGSALGSGGVFFRGQKQQRDGSSRTNKQYGGGGGAGGDGAGGASAQGGMGGAGRGGYVHVSDARNPPDPGRVAYPEDIFGSLELDGEGKFVDGNGRYQESGTYRIMTNDGILGLSDYLKQKVVQRLKELDSQVRNNVAPNRDSD